MELGSMDRQGAVRFPGWGIDSCIWRHPRRRSLSTPDLLLGATVRIPQSDEGGGGGTRQL